MGNKLKYRSTIKSRPYFYNETKTLAELLLKGLNDVEIKEKVIEENVLQLNSETRKKEVASTVLRRLDVLDEFLIEKMIHGDVDTSKIIVLYGILKTDRLFFEFVDEIFRDKLAYQEMIITDRDFYSFFEAKRQQSKSVAKWVDYTFYKLQQVYIRILFEAGLMKNQKGDRELDVPVINPDVVDHIVNIGDARFIHAIIGGE